MQFQWQSVWGMEGSHLLADIIINSNWLTFDSYLCQLLHRLLHAINTKCKVTQPTGLWTVHTLRWILFCKDLQLCVFVNTQIQLPVFTLLAKISPDNREAQLVYIKILGSFVV